MKKRQITQWLFANKKIVVAALTSLLSLPYMAFFGMISLSYSGKATGQFGSAITWAQRAIVLGSFIFPDSSERMFTTVMYVADMYASVEKTTNTNRGRAALEILKYIKGNRKIHGLNKARRLYEAACIANDALNPEIAGGILVKAKQAVSNSVSDEKLSALILGEKAFADLISVRIWPQRTPEWRALLSVEFEKSQNIICQGDSLECRFFSVRWNIGNYARNLWINGESNASSQAYHQIQEGIRRLCDENTTLDSCIRARSRIASYIDAFIFQKRLSVKEEKS
jgi:hypothetical protein